MYCRQQRVKLGSRPTYSSLRTVISDVPQGSAFLFMFIFQVISLLVMLSTPWNTQMSLVIPIYKNEIDDVILSQKEVNYFESWCKMYKMIINFDKSKFLNINFSCIPVSLILRLENTHVLKFLEISWKYLGTITLISF